MSNFNIKWFKENIKKENPIIFDIGCADMSDTLEFKKCLPNGQFYAFECKKEWEHQNNINSKLHNIHYFHIAISDMNGEILFYPSDKLGNQLWWYSGSICKPLPYLLDTVKLKFGNPYIVKSVTFETFCESNNIKPDLVHIDVQGAEYAVFSKMGNIFPKFIWSEVCEFTNYDTGSTNEQFDELLNGYGYNIIYTNKIDSLYAMNGIDYNPYQPI